MKIFTVLPGDPGTFVVKSTEPHVFLLQNYSGNFVVELAAPKAEAMIFGIYNGKGGDDFFLKTTQLHKAPGTKSALTIKGVFADQARFTYEGLIRIEKKAQKSEARLANHNLIMGAQNIVDAKPYLEILADDVRCYHAQTTGRINHEQINYLETRGLSEAHAKQLIATGFLDDIVNQFHNATNVA